MVLASSLRLAVLGTVLLFSRAQATFDFTFCVENCVSSSGCEPDSARCVCEKARELLLDSVISCLFFNCKGDLVNFEDAFLDPVEKGCKDHRRDIPEFKLEAAESLASSYIEKLPSTTTMGTTTAEAPGTTAKPSTTESPAASSSSSSSSTSTTTTATSEHDAQPSTSAAKSAEESASDTSAPTDKVTGPTSAIEVPVAESSTASSSESSEPQSAGSNRHDSNPFAIMKSAVPAIKPLATLLGFSLALSVLALA
ncbi:hypothetical protein VTH06DRAFT_6127 [Thermothelomyces fergusii]